jgi:hypothetical protein
MISIESGLTGVGVGDGVEVTVGVGVRVDVGVAVGVAVRVGTAVGAGVLVNAAVGEAAARASSAGVASGRSGLLKPHAANMIAAVSSSSRLCSRFPFIVIFRDLCVLPLSEPYRSGCTLSLAT